MRLNGAGPGRRATGGRTTGEGGAFGSRRALIRFFIHSGSQRDRKLRVRVLIGDGLFGAGTGLSGSSDTPHASARRFNCFSMRSFCPSMLMRRCGARKRRYVQRASGPASGRPRTSAFRREAALGVAAAASASRRRDSRNASNDSAARSLRTNGRSAGCQASSGRSGAGRAGQPTSRVTRPVDRSCASHTSARRVSSRSSGSARPRSMSVMEKGDRPLLPVGPEGASHNRGLSPFSPIITFHARTSLW